MWAFGLGSPKGERLIYRGYELEVCKHPIGWRLGIFSHATRITHTRKSLLHGPLPAQG
jgi:hypothetical protein